MHAKTQTPTDQREPEERGRPPVFEVEDWTEETAQAMQAVMAWLWVQRQRAEGKLPN